MAICPNTGIECIHAEKKERKKREPFKIPTLEEVSNYCTERSNTVNADKFLSYYESNGWKVGRNSMKDWKAAVRTWEHNGGANGQNQTSSGRNGGRNFAEERQKQRDESNARILSKYNRVPGGVHRETACGEGKGNVVIENDEVSFMAVGPLRTIHGDADE